MAQEEVYTNEEAYTIFEEEILLMMLSEKPQYQNDQVEVSDPYQDSSSGPCRTWRERESLINIKLGRKKGGD